MLEIIKKRKSEYYIVNSKEASECERFAASELQKYLYLSTLCPLPIYSDKCDKYGDRQQDTAGSGKYRQCR